MLKGKRVACIGMLAVVVFSMTVTTFCLTGSTKAEGINSNLETIYHKTLLNGVYSCMNGVPKINEKKLTSFDTNIRSGYATKGDPEVSSYIIAKDTYQSIAPYPGDTPGIYVPSGFIELNPEAKVNCYDIFSGGHGIKSVFDEFGKSDYKVADAMHSDPGKRNELFTSIGYEVDGVSEEKTNENKCGHLVYNLEYYDLEMSGKNPTGGPMKNKDTDQRGRTVCFEFSNGKLSRVVSDDSAANASAFDVYIARESISGYGMDVLTLKADISNFKSTVNNSYSSFLFPIGGSGAYSKDYSRLDNDSDCKYPTNCRGMAELNNLTWDGTNGVKSQISKLVNSAKYNEFWDYDFALGYGKNSNKCDSGVNNGNCYEKGVHPGAYRFVEEADEKGEATSASSSIAYRLNSAAGDSVGEKAARFFGGETMGSSANNLYNLSSHELVALYQYYLKTVSKGVVTCDNIESASGTEITWFVSPTEKKKCKIEVAELGDYYSVPKTESGNTLGVKVNTAEVLRRLEALNASQSVVLMDDDPRYFGEGDGMNYDASVVEGGTWNDAEERAPDCYTTAGAFGWVICPIANGLSSFLEGFYEVVIEPALIVPPELISKDATVGQGAAHSVWSTFRAMANLVFGIVLIVVIFSQVTGVGVSNYGIKKILPKLIIGILLINLSYVICQLAIDVSNIVGSSIGGFFESVMDNISWDPSALPEELGFGGIAGRGIALLLSVLASIYGGYLFVASHGGGWGMLVLLITGLLSVVLALVALYMMLSIRRAMVVILTILSPLAFICYMLPNTKKAFDLWFKTFKGLLIAYPICSLVTYGGGLVGQIMFYSSEGNLGVVIASAIVSVVPVFFIPKFVTSSLGALSGIVAKASGGLQKTANGAIKSRIDKSRMGALTRMNKAAYERRFKDNEYRAARSRTNRLTGKRTVLTRGGFKQVEGPRNDNERRLMTEANRIITGYQKSEEQPEIDALTLAGGNAAGELLKNQINAFKNGDKEYDEIKLHAAVRYLQQNGKYDILNKQLASLSSDDVKKLNSQEYAQLRNRLSSTLIADKNNNAAAAYYAKKVLNGEAGSTQTFGEYMNDRAGGFAYEASRAGADLRATQDDSTIDWMRENEYDSMWTDQQFAYGSDSEKHAAASVGTIAHMSEDRIKSIITQMSEEQLANRDLSELAAFGINSACSAERAKLESGTFEDAKLQRRYNESIWGNDTVMADAIVASAFISRVHPSVYQAVVEDKNGQFHKGMGGDIRYALNIGDSGAEKPSGKNRGAAARKVESIRESVVHGHTGPMPNNNPHPTP